MALPASRFRRGPGFLFVVVSAVLASVVPSAAPGASLPAAASVSATAGWAPAHRAPIGPGVQMYTRGAQCTGNFVFQDRARQVYVGYAAHCAATGGATDTDGCRTRSLPLGTPVRFARGGSALGGGTSVGAGRLAYSSWATMRRLRTRASALCAYNDFALVRVGRAHVGKVNPSLPFWGGPTAIRRRAVAPGETVYSYGSSSLRGGRNALSPKQGLALGDSAGGWSHRVFTLTPGIPGDSGSAFLDAQGRAVGTLSTIAVAPLPASNGAGDLWRQLAFAQRHSGIRGLRLVPGTVRFSPLP